MSALQISVGISGRHLHLSRKDLDALFGEGYELTLKKELSQPGQFASEEVVDVVSEKGAINKLRVLGPVRKETQIEIALTDAIKLKMKPPVRESGDLAGSPGVTLVGPKGKIVIDKGVIVAARHIHMTPADAAAYGVSDQETVKVRFGGPRAVVFENVVIRVRTDYALEMHIDTDEGNAAQIANGDIGEIIKG